MGRVHMPPRLRYGDTLTFRGVARLTRPAGISCKLIRNELQRNLTKKLPPLLICGQVGDVIESVDGKSIKDMKPEDVAMLMAGDLNTYVTIKTTSGVEARLKRDVSAEEADQATVAPKKKQESKKVESAKAAPAQTSPSKSTTSNKTGKVGMKLTPEECAKHGVKEGATWGPGMGHFAPHTAIYRMPYTQTVEVKGVRGTQV